MPDHSERTTSSSAATDVRDNIAHTPRYTASADTLASLAAEARTVAGLTPDGTSLPSGTAGTAGAPPAEPGAEGETTRVALAPVPAVPVLKVVGLDLSLGRTGVATAAGAASLIPPSPLAGFPRMRWIRAQVQEWTDGADLVVVEAPAFSSNGKYAKEIAGLWHVVMIAVDARGIRWLDVMSSSLKKYATGKGAVGKDEMVIAAVKRLPIDVTNNDEADAGWLCALGHDLLGEPLVTLPQAHRAALDAPRVRLQRTGEVV